MNGKVRQFGVVLLVLFLLVGTGSIFAVEPDKNKITMAIEEVERILIVENARIQATKWLDADDLQKKAGSTASDREAFEDEINKINDVITRAKNASKKIVEGFVETKKNVTDAQLSGSGARGDLKKTAAAKANQQKAFAETGTAILEQSTLLRASAEITFAVGAATNHSFKAGDQVTNLGKALTNMATVLADFGQFVADSAKEGIEADKAFFSAVGSMNKASKLASETESLAGSAVEAYAAANGAVGVWVGISAAEKAIRSSQSRFNPDGTENDAFDRNGADGRGEATSDVGSPGSQAGVAGAEAECAGMGDIGNDSDSDSDASAGEASDPGSCGPL